jgi:capsule polysaccharide modification protein KpsS
LVVAELSGRHFLLLQGPAGPFFARVAKQLREAGARVSKVNFNGGEDLYFRGAGVVRFRRAAEAWPDFFEVLARQSAVDTILLFGDCRPLHRAAIERAKKLGIEVWVFEEGYLRPDFVTLEQDGVNGHSNILRSAAAFGPSRLDAQAAEHTEHETEETEQPHRSVKHAFLKSAVHTICYAAAAAITRPLYPTYRHHRDIRPLFQAAIWARGAARRVAHSVRDRELDRKLRARELSPYFFVPLQVHLDSQLGHSRFGSIDEFITEVVTTFAQHAPPDHRLLLKLHPMDRPYSDYGPLLQKLGSALGLGERLIYADVINLPAALRGARGTIVINSTVGLSSLTHGTPVKCLGKAVYDIEGLTHQGTLAEFFQSPSPVDRGLYRQFRRWLLAKNQLNGSVWSRLHESPERVIASAHSAIHSAGTDQSFEGKR